MISYGNGSPKNGGRLMNIWSRSGQRRVDQSFRFASAVAVVFLVFPLLLLAQNNAPQRRVRVVNPNIATGPEVGQKIPDFRAPDQNGKMQDLNSVRGPKGAMVVFFRSADW